MSASWGLSVDSVTIKSTTGARVTSLTIFHHGINVPPAVYPKTPPNILSSSCHAHRSTAVDRFLFAGCFQSRDRRERSKATGVPLQPLRGSALSVGLGVLLRGCATGASWIGCPHTLLTRAVCAHGRPILATTFKPAHDQGRSRGLRHEIYAVVCGSFVCRVAVKSTLVAIAQCAPCAS